MADVGGAALGALFGSTLDLLYEAVTNVVTNAVMFKPNLESLKSKLETLDRLIKQITELNEGPDNEEEQIRGFTEQMKAGKELVGTCLEIGEWNPKKSVYGAQLSQLEQEIQNSIDFFLPLFQARIGLENRNGIRNIQSTVSRIESEKLAIANDTPTTRKIYRNLSRRNGKLSCSVPPPPKFTVGLDVHTEELKRQLLDEKVPVLLVTAPPGCGKTTLVKKLCQDQEIKGKFGENIFFISVSKTPSPKVIVDKLFEHKDLQVPEFESDEDAIDLLGVLLEEIKSPSLLILDDVWSESIFKDLEFDIPEYQILVTSRDAFGRDRFTYDLPPLNDTYAKKLMCYSAELKEESPPVPNEEMKKILKVCGGYPVALEVIGRTLSGELLEAWHILAEEWSCGHSILDSHSKLLNCLQRSLEFLDDTTKECFLDLGLFPEDQRILVAALIDMWAESHKLDGHGLKAVRNLHKISRQHLANLFLMRKDVSDVGNYYSEDFVLQHDLLRELAIHESSKEPIEQRRRLILDISENDLPNWWLEQKPQTINAQLLSITTDEKFLSSWCNIEPSKVEVLVLNFQTRNYTLLEFVAKAHKLKVLIVTNYGFFCAQLGNFELLEFAHYLKRIRLEKVSTSFFCKAPIRLRSLEKISLFMCNVGQAFTNCSIPILEALPNLKEINIDYCNDLMELPDELCEITCLKKLSITNCHKLSTLPQGIGKLINLEVLRLRSCTDLWELPESIRTLNKLNILDISDCLGIFKLPKHIGELHNLKKLHMEGCLRLRHQLPDSTLDLEQLELVTCDEARAKSWEPIKEVLLHLQVEVAAKDANLNWLRQS